MAQGPQLLVAVIVDPDKLPPILEAWREAGVPGSTVLPSLGMRRARGLLSAVWPLEQSRQRTLFAVVDDPDTVRRAIAATTDIIGDFSGPNTGILFTVPVGEALGLVKRGPPAEEEAEEEPPALEIRETGLAMDTPVSSLLQSLPVPPVVVAEDARLEEVARQLGERSNVRTVCVVDGSGHLVGLIPGAELGEDIFFHLMPEEFLREVAELEDVEAFVARSRVREARDAMQKAQWVRPEDPLREVFRKMHKGGVDGLPVVDEEMRITGYLNLPELLRAWLAGSG